MSTFSRRARQAAAKAQRRPEQTTERSRSVGYVPAGNPHQIETDFAELEDGTLIEVVEHATDPTKTLLAIYQNGSVRLDERFESDGRVFVPKSRNAGIFSRVRLPKGTAPYQSVRVLHAETTALLASCLDLDLVSTQLISFFVLSSWFTEKLTVAPYVALVGMPRSGKTTLLRLLELLCRHSILVADISSAAFYEVYNQTIPTLLIDETSTAAEQKKLFHLLRSGSTPGFVALRKGSFFNCYGPKVFAWTELPKDRALNTRCLVFPLSETARTNLKRPTDPLILKGAEHLQKQYLQLRLEKFNMSLRPNAMAPIGDYELQSRSRDLFEALVYPIADDQMLCDVLAWHITRQEQFTREPLSVRQMAVLGALAVTIHPPESPAILVADVARRTNNILWLEGEGFITPHAVGDVLTSLGICGKRRTNRGWVLELDQELQKKIHLLLKRHSAGFRTGAEWFQKPPNCPFCKEV